MLHATTPEQLAAVLRSTPLPIRSVIGIDGAAGSGKSTLASALGPILHADVISVDEFAVKNDEGQYVKHLQLPELRSALKAVAGHAIVDGVCLLQVLDAVSVRPSKLVYVKKVDAGNGWQDEEEYTGNPDETIARLLEEFHGMFPDETAIPALHEEIIRYHAEYRPHERATVEYWVTHLE